MTAPNIVSVSTITGKTAVQVVGASPTAIVTNSGSSGTVLKINSLYAANVTASAASITVDIYRSSVAYRITYAISIPAGTTLDILSKAIYLEEGDTLRLTSGTASAIEAVSSYEVIA